MVTFALWLSPQKLKAVLGFRVFTCVMEKAYISSPEAMYQARLSVINGA